jgi:hypothetical protein
MTQDMGINLSRNSMGWMWNGGAKLFVCWCFEIEPASRGLPKSWINSIRGRGSPRARTNSLTRRTPKLLSFQNRLHFLQFSDNSLIEYDRFFFLL